MSKQTKNIPKLRFPQFANEKSWEEKKLGEVAAFINGRAYKQEELLDKGKYRVLRVGNFFTNNSWYYSDLELEEDKYCDDGDLLYAWSASFGPRIWKGEKVIYHYHIWKVISSELIDKDFLFVLLDKETERMKTQNANGFALLHITKGTIENWICLKPKDIREQQKIASCLSSLDEVITAESQKLDVLKEHKKGLLQNLFPQEGERVPKLRFKEFKGEWEEKKLEEVATFVNEKTPLENLSISSYISTENILPDFAGVTSASKLPTSGNFTKYRKGDVLISNIRPYLKKVWFSDKEGAGSNDVFVVRTKSDIQDFFLSFLLKNDNFINYVMVGAKGVKMPRGDKDLISKYPISFPSKTEQQKIASGLSSLDEIIQAQAEKIELLQLHKKGLLQGLFPKMND